MAPTAPIALTLASPAPVFVATSPVLTFATDGTTTTDVAVQNPGPTPLALRPAEFTLVTQRSGLDVPSTSPVAATSVVPTVIDSGDVSAVTLHFDQPFVTTMTGAALDFSFVPSAKDPVVPAAAATPIALTLDRLVTFWSAWGVPLVFGLVFAIITSVLIRVTVPSLPPMITAASGWKFSDSWATNITALGAAAVTVATTTGAAAKILPGVMTAPFGILTAACGALVLLAPLVIALKKFPPKAAHRPTAEPPDVQEEASLADIPDGVFAVIDVRSSAHSPGVTVSGRMLLVAAFITLAGVGVELSTLGVLAHLSTATFLERLAIYVVLLAVGVIVCGYAIYTTYQLVDSQDSTGSRARSALNARSALSGPGGASLTL